MSKIAAKPLLLKDVELIIGAGSDDYSSHCPSVKFLPQTTTVSTGAVDGFTASETIVTGWVTEWLINQDWGATGLASYLYDHAGEEVAVTFRPKAGTGLPEFTSMVTLAYPEIGGAAAAYATSTVSMGCSKPEKGNQV